MKTKAITTIMLTLFLTSIMAFNVGSVQAVTIDIAPDTLNVYNTNGNYITAHIEPSVLFKDDFEDAAWTYANWQSGPNMPPYFVPGVWEVRQDDDSPGVGVYCSSTSENNAFTTYAGSSSWTDYKFNVKMKILGAITAPGYGPAYRVQSDNVGQFVVQIWRTGGVNKVEVYKWHYSGTPPSGSWGPPIAGSILSELSSGVWYDIEIVVNGNSHQVTVYKEGTSIGSLTFADGDFPSGKIGLNTAGHTHFDDLIVLEDFDVNTIDVEKVKLWHLMFSDNFERDSIGLDWQWISGKWTLEDDIKSDAATKVLSGVGGSYVGEVVAVAGSGDWADYVFEIDAKKSAGNYFNIVFRYVDTGNYYLLEPSADEVHIALFKRVDNVFTELAPRPSQQTTVGTWYHYKFVISTSASGTRIQVFVDGVQHFDVVDNTPELAKGKIGVGSWSGSDAHFDDIVVLSHIADALSEPTVIGDYDNDMIPDLMVKFDRATVADYIRLTAGITSGEIELAVTGQANGADFAGSDSVRVIAKGKIKV